jgi:hypothetical protein
MYSGDIWVNGGFAAAGIVIVCICVGVIYWCARTYDSNNRLTSRASRKKNMMTGSMGNDPILDILDSRPLGGVYLMGDGDVVPFLSAAPDDAEDSDEYDMAQMAVRYVMYALDRDDWKREFAEWEATLEESLHATKEAILKDRLRASLRVIPGGKIDDDERDSNE